MLTGHVDNVRRDLVSGWAVDTDFPEEPVKLGIEVNGVEIGCFLATQPRRDLIGVYGDGRHGFSFNFPEYLPLEEDHEVVVQFVGSDAVVPRGKFRIHRSDSSTPTDTVEVTFHRNPFGSNTWPARRPKYVIHVGLPKTGTKYLQRSFWVSRHKLLDHGIYYPCEWWPQDSIFAHHELAAEISRGPSPRLVEIFSELNASGADLILLSCEGFVGIPKDKLEHLHRLMGNSDVEIVFYTRRWSDWIPSQWQQAIKQGSSSTLPEYVLAMIQHADQHPGLNHRLILDKFSDVFGRNSIRIVSYSNLMDQNIDIRANFFSSILRFPPEDTGEAEVVHESMGVFTTELIRCMNYLETQRAGFSSHQIFYSFARICNHDTVKRATEQLYCEMEKSMNEFIFDDNSIALRDIFAEMNEKYRDRITHPELGTRFFELRARPFSYVGLGFLLQGNAASAISSIYEAVSTEKNREALTEV